MIAMISSWDQTSLFWIQAQLVNGILSPLMLLLSTLGNLGAVWIAAAIGLFCTKKYRRAGIAVFIALFFSLAVGNGLLKHLVMRARPCMDFPWLPMLVQLPAPNDFSFPSGHTFASFAAAAAMFRVLPRWLGRLAFGLAAGIGFSRVYLCLHYPSDVLAAAVLGIGFGLLAWRLSAWAAAWLRSEKYPAAADGQLPEGNHPASF